MEKDIEIKKEEQFRKLSSSKKGLSEKEAEGRLKKYGYNVPIITIIESSLNSCFVGFLAR